MTNNLPPLPPCAPEFKPRWPNDPEGYTAEQMKAYARATLSAAPQPQPAQPEICPLCNGSGIGSSGVHSLCVCQYVGAAPQPQPVQEPVGWIPIETAPKDSSMLRLLVNFDDHSLEDGSEPCWTIGTNALSDTGIDEWLFAGWDWTHDRFTQGNGTPIGWLPMLYTSPQSAPQPLTVAGGAVFQDAEGKRPVTAIGQPVGRWEPTPLYPPGCAGVFLERPQAQPLSDEQIQEAVTQAVKEGNLSWLGFKKDGMGMYTVPDLSPAHYQLARAIEQAHGITKGKT